MSSVATILEPSGCLWNPLERVPGVPSVSLTYFSVIQCGYIRKHRNSCPIRHISFFSLGTEGSSPRGFQAPSVELRGCHGTLKHPQIRSLHSMDGSCIFLYTRDFMKKVPTATCALRFRQIVSIERVYTPRTFFMKSAVCKTSMIFL